MTIGTLASAFRNLTPQARTLQIIRLVLGVVSLIAIIIALVGPSTSIKFYFARINCSHLDVSQGIYDSLRNSVSESNESLDKGGTEISLPIDSSLTNSEIDVLSEYAEKKVENAPQYFASTLWRFCVGYYNVTTYINEQNVEVIRKFDDTLKCTKTLRESSIFKYREAMLLHGMEGVMAYSLKTKNYIDRPYSSKVTGQVSQYRSVPITLMLSAVFTLALLLYEYILYQNRNGKRDVMDLAPFLVHSMVVVLIMPFIVTSIAACTITILVGQLRREVSSSFGSFGLAVQFGKYWFLMVWLGWGCSVLVMLSWIVPAWCANPPEDDYNEYYSRARDFGKRAVSRQSQVRPSSVVSEDPRDKLLYADSDSSDEEYEDTTFDVGRSASKASSAPSQGTGSRDVFFDPKEEIEHQKLRKLGESLSRSTSVRHLNRKGLKGKPKLSAINEAMMTHEETKDYIYKNHEYSPLPHHYRVETFDGFSLDRSDLDLQNPFEDTK